MKSNASLVVRWCVALLAVVVGPIATSRGQNNGYEYESGYTGALTSDLLFGPEWRAYEFLTQPEQRILARPVTVRSATPAPLPSAVTPAVPSLPKQTEYALRFFGGESARQTLQQLPQRPSMVSSTPVPAEVRVQKPFLHASNGPTISPYLNLDRLETAEELPNYYAFVRPQFDQLDINRRQQRELQRLDRKVQMTAYGAGVNTRSGPPGTGHGTRFGNTGQYYSGWRR